MKQLIKILPLFLLSFLIVVKPASAESVSLGISPSIFQIEAMPPADVHAPFTVSNQGNKPVELKILLLPFRASDKENGEIQYIRSTNPTLFEKIQVIDQEKNEIIDVLPLGPKQEKKLELRIVVSEKEQSADYYFSIVFLTIPQTADKSKSDEKNNVSTAQGGISANVLLSIGPKEDPKGYLEDFSSPWYVESGPVPFTIRVRNNGSHVMAPRGSIIIKNMYGQKIGKVEIPPTNILAGTVRSLIDLEQAATNSAHVNNAKTNTIWPEKFLLGAYQADLTLALSDKGPLIHKSITFIAFPIKLLLGVIIGIILIATVYVRVKKRLQTE